MRALEEKETVTTEDVSQGQGLVKHAKSGHRKPLTNQVMHLRPLPTWVWEITTTAGTHLPIQPLLTSGATQLIHIKEQTTVTQVRILIMI